MSPLAVNIYDILRNRVNADRPELTYADLVEILTPPYNTLDPDSPIIATALEELATACRAYGLPAISAMVVGEGGPASHPEYYRMAYPEEVGDPDKSMEWGVQLQKVRSSTYPPAL